MVSRITTVAFNGIEAIPVDVQVMITPGKMGMNIVGLADKAVGESKERVQAALHACGLSMPVKKVMVNLAPADLPKEGSHYDLPIAIALMVGLGVLPAQISEYFLALGELSLDGTINGVNGVLPAAMTAVGLNKGIICPQKNGSQAAWASATMEILAPSSLLSLVNHFKGAQVLSRPQPTQLVTTGQWPDLSDIKGQETAKRALEVAAAGCHNILFVGPPGSGKSMLAQRLPSILPPLNAQELLEVSLIKSIAGLADEGEISRSRPFQAPHHSASMAAMVGGGIKARPGEVTLAHNGVLFLDEFPEFAPKVLDSLRQPLESGECVVARANFHLRYPARFQLVAAMNPCRCGMAGEPGHVCARGARCQSDYQARISGPLLDRIDLRVEVPALSALELIAPKKAEASATVLARVLAARQRQYDRYQNLSIKGVQTNGHAPANIIEKIAKLDEPAQALLSRFSEKARLSARGYHRVLKLSRTIADLDQSLCIKPQHVGEAIAYRGQPSLSPVA